MRKEEKVFRFSLFTFRFSVLVDRKQRTVSRPIGFGTVEADPTGQGRQRVQARKWWQGLKNISKWEFRIWDFLKSKQKPFFRKPSPNFESSLILN
jgi:hypothetical protein